MKRLVYLVICAAIGFSSCQKNSSEVKPISKTDTTETTGTTGTTGSTVATGLDNAAMLQMVNNVRATGCTCGTTVMPAVAPLTWNDVLAAAALQHSQDMNTTGNFSHNSSDGTSFSDRITAAGYTNWRALGENIAYGYTTEQAVFNGWLQSEGHCKNMMSASFKEMGAAKAGTYWTQDFGAK
ncbi:MAG TPA: CAP domain-containing protein [Mucilaginibacter sp.]